MKLTNGFILGVVHHQKMQRTFADFRVRETRHEKGFVEKRVGRVVHEFRFTPPAHVIRFEHSNDVTLQLLVPRQAQTLDNVDVKLSVLLVEIVRELEFTTNLETNVLTFTQVYL